MTVETAADRAIFLSDFGEDIKFIATGYAARVVKCIFDNVYQEVEAGMSVGISMQQPRILCRTSDIPGVTEGTTVIRGGVTYVVRVVMSDGLGMSELILEKQ